MNFYDLAGSPNTRRERCVESINEYTIVKNIKIDVGEGVGDTFSTPACRWSRQGRQ